MWFEARRQEKKLRNIMVDQKKRAERRRQFYEKIKKDPAEFMQIHGRSYKVHLEQSIALAAESPAILRPWQGDPNILIDRFDARSHLDFIRDFKAQSSDYDCPEGDWEERQSNYERYRILVLNEFEKVPEEKFLKQIFVEENFGLPANQLLVKAEEEKKKKLAEQKAAIAFTYEDSTTGGHGPGKFAKNFEEESSESSDDDEIEPEIDSKRLDVSDLSNEQCKELNIIATKYRVKMGDFVKLLWQDHDDHEKFMNMKDLEDEKAALAGKQSRRERKMLKDLRIRERGFISNPLSVLRVGEAIKDDRNKSDSSSSSDSSEDIERVQYITSFGGGGSDGETAFAVQGPAPPPSDARKRLQELRNRRSSSSCEKVAHKITSSSKSRNFVKNNRNRSRSRSRSRRRRSRSSSYDGRRRSSSSRKYRSSRQRSSRSSSRKRRPASKIVSIRESERRRNDGDKPKQLKSQTDSNVKSMTNEQIHIKEEDAAQVRQLSSPRSVSSNEGSNLSPLSLHTDMSESERERREVENTRRRLKRTKKAFKRAPARRNTNSNHEAFDRFKAKNVSVVEKLKLQTQKALKKTLEQDKREERQKYEDMKREQIEREEEIREMSNLLRKKEREKYLAEKVEADRLRKERSSSSSSRKYKRRRRSRSRSRSNGRHHSKHSSSRKRKKSRSRNRSRSKSKNEKIKKLVDY